MNRKLARSGVAGFCIFVLGHTCSFSAEVSQDEIRWSKAKLDDCEFEDNQSSIGTKWTATLDKDRGGSSSIDWFSTAGTFGAKGAIKPVPGSMGPGTAGMILPLGANGEEFDISQWDGVRITIKHSGAPLLLRIHSSEIANGDYFAKAIPESSNFETYSFGFDDFGQVMSAQKPWLGKNVSGVELSSFGWTTLEFSWEIDEIGFFRDEPAE